MTQEKIRFDDNDGYERELPGKYVVCDRCRGRGSHCNPAIDGNGISPEEFAEDPDFAESYFRGDYDVPCDECKGLRVVLVPDEARADPALVKVYREIKRAEYQALADERRAIELGY